MKVSGSSSVCKVLRLLSNHRTRTCGVKRTAKDLIGYGNELKSVHVQPTGAFCVSSAGLWQFQ